MELRRIIRIITTMGISVLYLSVCVTSSTVPPSELRVNKTEFSPIVGGYYARSGEFPWMAVVHQLLPSGGYASCGGSVISTRWVVTAGHCILSSPKRFLVVLGEIDKSKIKGEQYLGQGIAMITTKVVRHPRYIQTGQGIFNDIALLYMPKDIKFGDNIKPIELPRRWNAGTTLVGKTGIITGWGNIAADSAIQDLKWGAVPIISNRECSGYWRQVGKKTICTAARAPAISCGGDSGGPLALGTDSGPMLIGIVSFSGDSCSGTKPVVFTRVSSYVRWIQEVTNEMF